LKTVQIIDAHQHFWDLERNYIPWLRDEPQIPFRYGDYSAIRRTYLPADYLADASGFEIAGTVFVEAEWNPADPIGEVEWVGRLRETDHLPSVMVAQAWLDRPDAPAVLEPHGRTAFVRGIRHKPRAARSPDDVIEGAPGSMGDPRWRSGYRLLSPNGLSFDLQTPWWHLAEARRLADDFPETQIILNHTGLPADRTAEGLAGWRAAMRLLAGAPNVAVKISGLGQAGRPWSADENRAIVLETIEIFGVSRAMFASNFPVDSLVGTFGQIFSGFDQMTAGFSDEERAALFAGNARTIYRIPTKALRQPASAGAAT
jgi:predicted TIM-barrel fold metal-dependent hydrolase